MNTISSSTGVPLQSVAPARVAAAAAQWSRSAVTPPTVPADAESGTPPAASAQAAKLEPNDAQLKQITAELQRRVSAMAPGLEFAIDRSSGQTIIKFIDRTTNEVIQQFPSEAILQIGKELDRFQKGLLLNRKA